MRYEGRRDSECKKEKKATARSKFHLSRIAKTVELIYRLTGQKSSAAYFDKNRRSGKEERQLRRFVLLPLRRQFRVRGVALRNRFINRHKEMFSYGRMNSLFAQTFLIEKLFGHSRCWRCACAVDTP